MEASGRSLHAATRRPLSLRTTLAPAPHCQSGGTLVRTPGKIRLSPLYPRAPAGVPARLTCRPSAAEWSQGGAGQEDTGVESGPADLAEQPDQRWARMRWVPLAAAAAAPPAVDNLVDDSLVVYTKLRPADHCSYDEHSGRGGPAHQAVRQCRCLAQLA